MGKQKENEIRLSGKKVVVSPMTLEEAQAVLDETEAPELKKAYGEMVDGAKNHPDEFLWYIPWKMRRHGHRSRVGDLSFKGAAVHGGVELGYGVLEKYEKHGYTTEAVGLLTDWALKQKGVYGVFAETDPDNSASKRVLEKNGFSPCGEGAEGDRFVKLRSRSGWPAILVCLFVAIGIGFGVLANMALFWGAFGLAAGIFAALIFAVIEDGKLNRALTGDRKCHAPKDAAEAEEPADEVPEPEEEDEAESETESAESE